MTHIPRECVIRFHVRHRMTGVRLACDYVHTPFVRWCERCNREHRSEVGSIFQHFRAYTPDDDEPYSDDVAVYKPHEHALFNWINQLLIT